MTVKMPKAIDTKLYSFGDLPQGQAFIMDKKQTENPVIFIKIEEIENINAVNLVTGNTLEFVNTKEVFPIVAEIKEVKFI